MKHFPEKIYDMRGNNNGLYRVAVVWCAVCRQQWGEGSWLEGMKGYDKAHQPTFSEGMTRLNSVLKRVAEAAVPDTEREDYKAYERWREDRAVRG
jgi:hypothetical protein